MPLVALPASSAADVPTPQARAAVRVVALLMLLTLGLAGCGSAPVASPPSGVDGLEVPTPSPDPADFVAGVDHPLLAYRPGARWVYATSGSAIRVVVEVLPDPRMIAGVETTAVRTTTRGQPPLLAWFAQDVEGNVWQFGGQVAVGKAVRTWRAGERGALAGLAMPAVPRVGDGFRRESAPGIAEDLVTVVALNQSVEVPAGEYDDAVLTDVTTPLRPGAVDEATYASGVGLLALRSTSGGDVALELLRHEPPK